MSATYALSKAAEGDALQAAAYAAYSSIYGYGGYAVNDPDFFAEVHQRQLSQLLHLKSQIEQGVPEWVNAATAIPLPTVTLAEK